MHRFCRYSFFSASYFSALYKNCVPLWEVELHDRTEHLYYIWIDFVVTEKCYSWYEVPYCVLYDDYQNQLNQIIIKMFSQVSWPLKLHINSTNSVLCKHQANIWTTVGSTKTLVLSCSKRQKVFFKCILSVVIDLTVVAPAAPVTVPNLRKVTAAAVYTYRYRYTDVCHLQTSEC